MRGLRKKAPETKKAKKAAKDPNKPKRPASAFLIFLKEIGKQFKEKNRGIKSAFGRAGGDKWKQLSDAEKAPYMAEAKKRMAEFKKNKDAYNRRVAAGSAEEVESDKSTSEVDEEEESGEEEEDGDDD
ncbi:HMG1/2-like protein isoform X3 [Nicotiana sylvestris]|uniref:HMG1/2-like protein n=1 Tax=Nicotiana sylvestris TaxID=4096 RepID=A0A1U7XEX5_NICSY|nr:PREDICTED: HMG1/2-like protein [Nicotiana sylvestris]